MYGDPSQSDVSGGSIGFLISRYFLQVIQCIPSVDHSVPMVYVPINSIGRLIMLTTCY